MRAKRIIFHSLLLLLCLSTSVASTAQTSPYQFSYETKEQSLLKTLVFFSGVQFHNFSIDRGVITDIGQVNPKNLWKIDKPAINLFSESADHWSDITLYASMTMPLILNASSRINKTDKWNIALMGLQGFMIENGINSLVKNLAQRPRPFLYNNDWIISNRSINKNSSRSFYSGHTSTSSYMCFLGAKTFSDLYPNSKWKPVVWGVAITLPAVTGYLRYRGGQHFPTDIITGYVIGGAIGFLIPELNKSKVANLTIGMTGLQFSLRL